MALHIAREATEVVFRELHPGIEDVAPGIKGKLTYLKTSRSVVKELIDSIMAGTPALEPARELEALLSPDKDPFAIGLAAARASIALLGMGEYGGVFAAWQLQSLSFDWMTWEEHAQFNDRILESSDGISLESMEDAAEAHTLPGPEYLMAGCHGNIAKAWYRRVAEALATQVGVRAKSLGDRTMDVLASTSFTDATRAQLEWPTMLIMRAATSYALGDRDEALSVWRPVSAEHAECVVARVRQIEPAPELVALVANYASSVSHSLPGYAT